MKTPQAGNLIAASPVESARYPLKWYLIVLVVGSLFPVVAFAALVLQRLSQQERATAERRLIQSSRDLANNLDREIASTVKILQALAESERLEKGELREFYEEARRVMKTQPSWLTIILATPQGQQALNTMLPFQANLPPVNEPESLQRVLATQRPLVGYLVRGLQDPQYAFPVRVPVLREGKILYVLSAILTPDSINQIIGGQALLSDEWTRTVVDSRGIVIARTRVPERFIGSNGTQSFLRRLQESTDVVYRETSLEGEPVYFAYSRVNFPNWTLAVVAPRKVIEGPARRSLLLIVTVGLGLLLVSGSGAFVLSRFLSRNIVAAAAAAGAVARGERPELEDSRVAELAQLQQELSSAAALLAQREEARTEHLKQAEQARAEAETANRLKDEFLATVSHELRTPLNAMLGYAKLLKNGGLGEDKARQAVQIIERNAYQQAQLIEDLLDVSRIITGNLRIVVQPLDLAQVIENALDAVRPAAEAKGVKLLARSEGAGQLAGDAGRLQQVVWNLLSNAVKFTPGGGQVEIQTIYRSTQVELLVRDTGQGIAPKFLPYVFDRFRQADGSTTRAAGGLGLGLAIVRHLVELHGGTVSAMSEGPGLGATITVKLPLQALTPTAPPLVTAAANGHQRAAQSREGWPALQGLTVLLVDDEPEVRLLVREILEQCGAQVLEADSAELALRLAHTTPLSIIVADIGMPGEDGYSFLRKYREQEQRTPPVPAIALTAFSRTEDRTRVLRAGFRMHVPKPCDPLELLLVIANLTGRA